MERLRNAIARLCPHLQIKIQNSEILNNEELVFHFSTTEMIEPLYEMLKKYNMHVEIDIVENHKFMFIFF